MKEKTKDNNEDSYSISFYMHLETKYGQNVYVMGGIPELGNWKNKVAKMKWTANHVWKININLPSEIEYFEYKFVVSENENLIWEKGKNRLFSKRNFECEDNIRISGKWETFYITFLIYYPLSSPNEVLQIMGGCTSIGKWFKNGGKPVKMQLGNEERNINNVKGKFWEVKAEFDVNEPECYDFDYRYSIYNEIKGKIIC